MSVYYFEIADTEPAIPCVGEELPSLASARCFALKYAGRLICEQGPAIWNGEDWVMTITDANRLTLFTILVCVTAAPSTMKFGFGDSEQRQSGPLGRTPAE